MNKKRAKELAPIIQAFGEGKAIQVLGLDPAEWTDIPTYGEPSFSDGRTYRIKPVTLPRPMTRGEVLYMVTTTPAMVVRFKEDIEKIYMAVNCSFDKDRIDDIEYAIIDKHGDPIDGWYKFEIEDC